MDTNASANTVAHMRFNEYFLKTEGGFAYCYSNGAPQWHSHDDFYEFVVAAEGTFVSEYNGRKRRFGPGSVFFLVSHIKSSRNAIPNTPRKKATVAEGRGMLRTKMPTVPKIAIAESIFHFAVVCFIPVSSIPAGLQTAAVCPCRGR